VHLYGAYPEAIPMAEIKNPFRGVKLEYTSSHPLTKVVVIVLILVCMAALITLRLSGNQLKNEIADLRNEAAQLESDNENLGELVDDPDSAEGLEQVAQDELEYVDPDTIVIDPKP
jgi:cell division protein FtsB